MRRATLIELIQKTRITYRLLAIDYDVVFFRIYHQDESSRAFGKYKANNGWLVLGHRSPGIHPVYKYVSLRGKNRKMDFVPRAYTMEPRRVPKVMRSVHEAIYEFFSISSLYAQKPKPSVVEIHPAIYSIGDQDVILKIRELCQGEEKRLSENQLRQPL